MAYTALSAFCEPSSISNTLLTAVLPGGCPLDCPFCIVNQRDERRKQSHLSVDHMTELLSALELRGQLGGVAIVGDEPLQDHCWPMAEAFLSHAIEIGVPTALISNGYNLIDFIDELKKLPETKILISLDAASDKHDQIRRKPGAFARIEKGIRLASEDKKLRERISVATILMPGNLDNIPEIIEFTAQHKLQRLLLSPLLTSSRTTPLTVHPKIMRDAWSRLPAFLEQADKLGVKIGVSDEFSMLGEWEERVDSIGIEILAPKSRAKLIRVDAEGRIETLDSMRVGKPTGLSLPADPSEINKFSERLIEMCLEPIPVAA